MNYRTNNNLKDILIHLYIGILLIKMKEMTNRNILELDQYFPLNSYNLFHLFINQPYFRLLINFDNILIDNERQNL